MSVYTDIYNLYIDDENDYISVSTDEELMQALTAIPTGSECLKLFVKGINIYIFQTTIYFDEKAIYFSYRYIQESNEK